MELLQLILTILKYLGIGVLALLGLGVLLSILFILFLLFWWLTHDEVEEIDNSDGQIACGITDRPCIKDKLYTYCNNCGNCPIYQDHEKYGESE